MALLIATAQLSAAPAQANPHDKWHVGYPSGNTAIFSEAGGACGYAFAAWHASSPSSAYDGPAYYDDQDILCGWHNTTPMGPPFQYQPMAWLTCDNGYQIQNRTCVKASAPDQCNATPKPIDILTGDKRFTVEDYATADGGLRLERHFQSEPHLGLDRSFIETPLGLANWRFDFQYELQVPRTFTSAGLISLLAPDGHAYLFEKQSSGALLPYTPSARPLPQPDYKLEFLDTWPTSTPWTLVYSKSHWKMTDADDNVWLLETFLDPKLGEYRIARPTQMTAKSGLVLTMAYNVNGALTSISDNRGKSISFTWATKLGFPNGIATATLPGGDKLAYTYENSTSDPGDADRLKTVQLQNSSATVLDSTTYDYGNTDYPRAVTGVRDKNNTLRWSVTYDGDGLATSSYGPGNVLKYSVAYGGFGTSFTRTVTNPLGKDTVYSYTQGSSSHDPTLTGYTGTASTHCPSSAASVTWNTSRFIATTVDEEGRTTTYTRDSRGRPTQIKEATGTADERITNITWNATFNAPDQIVEPKKTTDYTYDSQGRVTSRTETDTTSYTTPYATNGRTRTWAYSWSSAGQLLTVDGPLSGTGDTVTFTYNSSSYLATVTNEVGQVTTVSSWNSRGQPLTVTDANSVATTLTYDDQGRPLTVTANPGVSQSQYAFAYDAVGHLTQLTLPGGGYLQYAYDNAGRPTLITNDRGETQTITTDLAGDVTGRVVKTSGGTITAQETAAYDELTRIIQSIGASAETTGYAYDKVDNLKTVTDARGKAWGQTFDALDRVKVKTDPESHTVQLAYDTADRITSHKDGRALDTTRIVDGFGQTIQEVSPDRGTLSYWYDAAGHLTKTVDGDGQQVDYAYDNAGRLLSSTYAGASAETITCAYDATTSGNKGIGRLTSVTEQSGATALTYDAQGRITGDAKTIQSQSYAVGYAYDTNGRITQITLPSGRTVSYARAPDGLVTGITTEATPLASSATVASGVTYKPFGPLAGLTYGNGLALTRTYDQNYWLSRIEANATSLSILDLSFGRNDNGQLTGVTDNIASGRAASFTYTDAGRLNGATGPWGADTYAYDAAGNRTDKARTLGGSTSHETPVIASASNRVNSVQDASAATLRTFTYATGGDLTQDARAGGATYAYVYNARKRLVTAKANGTDVGYYGYDYLGRRVFGALPGTTTTQSHYIFDEDGHLLAEHDGTTGTVLREYVWLDDTPIALIDSTSGTAKTYFIHTGQIDEPLVMTDSSKTKVWDAAIEPFGEAKLFGTPSAGLDLRLPGQWSEAETGGLSQNWHRNYDPSLGRYAQIDPLGVAANQNPYTYADATPLRDIDPRGLWSFSLDYYEGYGGGVTFGVDPIGGAFVNPHFGIGIGGGITWDPSGGAPGIYSSDDCACADQRPIGSFDAVASTGVGFGPLTYSGGAKAGAAWRRCNKWSKYAGVDRLHFAVNPGKWELRLEASAVVGNTFFFRR